MVQTVELLGTKHNSDESINRVETVIRDREPDVVGIELPPCVFNDEPKWSIRTALDPREPVTVPGLLLKQRMLGDDDLWQVGEMFVAARAAVDVGATVALIDRPFTESNDRAARALAADLFNWIELFRREFDIHRDRIDDGDLWETVKRDIWKTGGWSSPFVNYAWSLSRHGATDLRDPDQREAASKRMGLEGAEMSIDAVRAYLPRVMETHLDERDACMAGHLRWLADEADEVLGIVATGHLSGVAERLEGKRLLEDSLIRKPAYADPNAVRDYALDLE